MIFLHETLILSQNHLEFPNIKQNLNLTNCIGLNYSQMQIIHIWDLFYLNNEIVTLQILEFLILFKKHSLSRRIFFIVHKLCRLKKACVHPWYHKMFNNNCVNANNIKQTCLIGDSDSEHFNAQISCEQGVVYNVQRQCIKEQTAKCQIFLSLFPIEVVLQFSDV